MSNRFTSRLSDNDDFKRDELIRKIEHAVEHMTLAELIITNFRKSKSQVSRKVGLGFMSIKVYV